MCKIATISTIQKRHKLSLYGAVFQKGIIKVDAPVAFMRNFSEQISHWRHE